MVAQKLSTTHIKKDSHHIKYVPPYVAPFISLVLPVARGVKAKWGVPIAVLIAQAALETGWGQHVVGNAYFGIKGKAPDGQHVVFGTHEVEAGTSVSIAGDFRAYNDLQDAADDYGRVLANTPVYQGAFQFKNDPIKFAEQLTRYATDPDYTRKLVQIISAHNLASYDAPNQPDAPKLTADKVNP